MPRRDDRGDIIAFVVLWPALIMAILLLAMQAFITTNARAEASLAASQGLRAAWRAAVDSDLATRPADEALRLREAAKMSEQAGAAVERVAGEERGWRWWTSGVATIYSDWCHPAGASGVPGEGETGWVRVVVSGEVVGPLSWVWPGRLDRVYASAEGPALLRVSPEARRAFTEQSELPAQWSQTELPRC